MYIDSIFSFGKYKGERLIDVYKGCPIVKGELVHAYIERVLSSSMNPEFGGPSQFDKYFNLKIESFPVRRGDDQGVWGVSW
jgi:hypothetical protein